jgi:4-diphosphocytidyl-2-C-methyl-D-erythritol kinase
VILDAPAKLNLFLRVLAREESGFHQIETLFCALELCDEVAIERSTTGIDVTVRAEASAGDSIEKHLTAMPRENLVHRAAAAFFDAARLDGGASITLTKRIPSGAGLGGGSSDAAATLVALNELYGRPLQDSALLETAAQLGSDVPFFVCASPLALAWGRGTRLLALDSLPQKSVVLVAANETVATKDAYSDLAEYRARNTPQNAQPVIRNHAALRDWSDVAYNAVNDFEPVIFARIPELSRIRDDLARHDAIMARMTGSGSVVFGVFDDDDLAKAAADAIRSDFRNVRTILTRTVTRELSLSAPPPSLT